MTLFECSGFACWRRRRSQQGGGCGPTLTPLQAGIGEPIGASEPPAKAAAPVSTTRPGALGTRRRTPAGFDERTRAVNRCASLLLCSSRGDAFNVVGTRQRVRAQARQGPLRIAIQRWPLQGPANTQFSQMPSIHVRCAWIAPTSRACRRSANAATCATVSKSTRWVRRLCP